MGTATRDNPLFALFWRRYRRWFLDWRSWAWSGTRDQRGLHWAAPIVFAAGPMASAVALWANWAMQPIDSAILGAWSLSVWAAFELGTAFIVPVRDIGGARSGGLLDALRLTRMRPWEITWGYFARYASVTLTHQAVLALSLLPLALVPGTLFPPLAGLPLAERLAILVLVVIGIAAAALMLNAMGVGVTLAIEGRMAARATAALNGACVLLAGGGGLAISILDDPSRIAPAYLWFLAANVYGTLIALAAGCRAHRP